MAHKNICIALCAVLLAAVANGQHLAPGTYSLKNLGFTTCDQQDVYLGFNNKTCPIAPYSRHASIGTNSVWKSWDITVTGYHASGFPLAILSTGMPEGKTMRCPGNLSPLEPGTCGKNAVTLNGAASEWRLVGPVSGYTKPTYKLVANMKRSGCARYLATSLGCDLPSLRLLTSNESPRTLWELEPLQLGTRVPGEAHIVTVIRGTGSNRTVAAVSFSAPADPGCGPITSYTVTAKPISSGATITKTVNGALSATTLKGLTANVRYNVTIAATNACGTGPTSWYLETLVTSDAVVGAGYLGLCSTKADSRLSCLGDFSTLEAEESAYRVPTKWRQGNDIVQIVSNNYYIAVLARNGTLGVWGVQADQGCVVDGEDPLCVPESYLEDVAYIHGNYKTLCITRKNGNVKCAGDAIDNLVTFSMLPQYQQDGNPAENGLPGFVCYVTKAKVGAENGCVLYVDGTLACYGDVTDWMPGAADLPLPITHYKNIIDFGVSEYGICSVKASGDLACASTTSPGTGSYHTNPIPESFDRNIAAIECSWFGCCALKSNGDFTCWGDTEKTGEATLVDSLATIPNWIAGINKYTWRTFPAGEEVYPDFNRKMKSLEETVGGTSIRWPVLTEVLSFSLGYEAVCVIRADGSLQCWGYDTPPNNTGILNLQILLTVSGYDYVF